MACLTHTGECVGGAPDGLTPITHTLCASHRLPLRLPLGLGGGVRRGRWGVWPPHAAPSQPSVSESAARQVDRNGRCSRPNQHIPGSVNIM